jgi:hypothetical protein
VVKKKEKMAGSVALTLPVDQYAASISEDFPRITRERPVETSIASKSIIDILPTNLGSNHKLQDRYLEFRIPGIRGSLIDLGQLVLEIKLGITTSDGVTKLDDTQNVTLVNGTANTMFKSVQVYVGDQMVESNPYFSYWSFIKMITTLNSHKLNSLCKLGNMTQNYRDGGVPNVVTAGFFTKPEEKGFSTILKSDGLHLNFPLLLDIASCDQYLCDDIPIRLRLELAPESWILMSDQDGSAYQLNIDFAKLWVTRLHPYPSALASLNKALESGQGKVTKSIFNKTLYKSLVLGRQQSSIVADMPWGQIVPDNLYVCMVPMTAFSGAYNRNGLYFPHAGMKAISVTVNGTAVFSNTCKFPNDSAQLYYTCLESLGLTNDTLLTYESFKSGRMVLIYNLGAENLANTLPLQRSGNLRVSIQLEKGLDENMVVLLFGDTKGVLSVNADRSVFVETRA